MRTRLKGINRVTKRLSDGSKVTYFYAWKGGPRLEGKPGSPEFVASYHEAHQRRTPDRPGTLLFLLNEYQASAAFTGLSERTRRDYIRHIKRIETDFADFPLAALTDRRSRGEFLRWRDRLAQRSPRQADYALTVLARVLAWGFDRAMTGANPLERPGKVYRADRADKQWTADHEAAFLAVASPEMRLAFMLAIHTGQRQGDLLRLPWGAYDGNHIRLKQGKTGKRVKIPVPAPLRAELDATPRRSPIILVNKGGKPWTSDGFRTVWRRTCDRADIHDVTFHDLRGTAATRFLMAGHRASDVAMWLGWTLSETETMERYVSRATMTGEADLVEIFPNQTPNRSTGSE